MNSGISRDEWLAALGDAVKPIDPDAKTVEELSEAFGIGRQAAYLRLRKLVLEKKAIRAFKYATDSAGVRRRVPAYRLVKPKK